MDRRLGVFETAQALTDEYAPFNIVVALGLKGAGGAGGLRTALDLLQRRQPLLRVHLAKLESGFSFVSEGTPAIPLEVSESDDVLAWMAVVENELNRPVAAADGPLMRCTLIRSTADGARCDVVLTVHHAIIDGTGAVAMIRQLLHTWNELAAGREILIEELPAAAPAETSFPAAYQGLGRSRRIMGFLVRQMADELGYRWNARGTRRPRVHKTGRCGIVCGDFGAADLETLVRASRRRRVTLHSVLNAAMLLSVQKRLYRGRAVPLRNFNFVSLRRYLDPPPADEQLGSYHTMLRYTIAIDTSDDIWGLAGRVNSNVHKGTKRGDKYCFFLTSAGMMRIILRQRRMRMGSTALAYTGATPVGPRIGEITVDGFHAFVSNLVLGPEYTAQARLFRGRLWWDAMYLDSDMDCAMATAITDEILERLHDAARR